MAKKKEKKQTINNIQELNLEIDYDKLAESIIRVQNQSLKIDINKEYLSSTFSGKIANNYFALSLNQLLSKFFYILCVLDVLLTALTSIRTFNYIHDFLINSGHSVGYSIVVTVSIIFLQLFISAFLFCILINIAREIKKESDRNYIVSVFSGIVSFAALIVALVALFKGVG